MAHVRRKPFRRRGLLSLVLVLGVTLPAPGASPVASDAILAARLQDAAQRYAAHRREIGKRVGTAYGIDYAAAAREFEARQQEMRMKLSLLERHPNPTERERRQREIYAEYRDEQYDQYLEAYSILENELQGDHHRVADVLSELSEVLDALIARDPLLRHAFQSSEFRRRYGKVLRRVVWSDTKLQGVGAETIPMNVQALFADKAKIPMLIKLTPSVFHTLAYLRSILIHELEHVVFYKEPGYSDAEQFSGTAEHPAEGSFSHYFRSMNPEDPSYQYHLIQEYYGFRIQLLLDDRVAGRPHMALSPAARHQIESMLEWTHAQLNSINREFVQRQPDPPLARLLDRFYP